MKTVFAYELAIGDFIADPKGEFGTLVVADQPGLAVDEITLHLETPERSLGCTRSLAPEDTVTRYDDEDDFPEPEPKTLSASEGESGETKQPELTLERVAEAHDDLALYVAQLRVVAEQADYEVMATVDALGASVVRLADLVGDMARYLQVTQERVAALEAQQRHIYDVLDALVTPDPIVKLDKALAIDERAADGQYTA